MVVPIQSGKPATHSQLTSSAFLRPVTLKSGPTEPKRKAIVPPTLSSPVVCFVHQLLMPLMVEIASYTF